MKIKLCRLMSILHRLGQNHICRELHHYKIGTGEIGVLINMKKMNNPSQENLREKLVIDKGALARTIASLEKKHFLVRHKDDKDLRIRRISLTKEGERAAEATIKAADRWHKIVLGDISEDDISTAINVLQKMAKNATEYSEKQP